MNHGGVITGVSVNHRRASVDEIGAASRTDGRVLVEDLLADEEVQEAFVLQTCNRAEAYVVTDDAADGRRALEDFAPTVREGAVVDMDHEESLRHLMRVAAGLESLVLGEDQILGQVKTAIEEARAVGGVGTTLEDALLKAVHVGERARTETAINEGVLSLGSAAVRLADERATVEGATALVVGAGEMGTLSARALADAGVAEVVVANRTIPHAEHVACELGVSAEAVGLDALPDALDRADIVITATNAPEYVLDDRDLREAGETLVIDIAQPRDVDPAAEDLRALTVEDIDALEAVADDTREMRREEARQVERMIEEEFDELIASFKRKRADDAISRMYESAERVKASELDEALTKLESKGDLTEAQRETVVDMADALVGQLLAAPTKSLREAAAEDDWTTIQTAMRLFNPEFGDGPSPASGVSSQAIPEELSEGAEVPQELVEQLSED
ncbi:MAG: glutamyl-tRNA reductase [Haloferacaceae archaeon]